MPFRYRLLFGGLEGDHGCAGHGICGEQGDRNGLEAQGSEASLIAALGDELEGETMISILVLGEVQGQLKDSVRSQTFFADKVVTRLAGEVVGHGQRGHFLPGDVVNGIDTNLLGN